MNGKVVGLFNWNSYGKLELVQLYENHIVADENKFIDARADCESRYPKWKIKDINFDRDNYGDPPGFVVCAFRVGHKVTVTHEEIYISKNVVVKG